jgi:hypothetical protein
MGRHKKVKEKLLIDDVAFENVGGAFFDDDETTEQVDVVTLETQETCYECTRKNLVYGSEDGQRLVFTFGDKPVGLTQEVLDDFVSRGYFKKIN